MFERILITPLCRNNEKILWLQFVILIGYCEVQK